MSNIKRIKKGIFVVVVAALMFSNQDIEIHLYEPRKLMEVMLKKARVIIKPFFKQF